MSLANLFKSDDTPDEEKGEQRVHSRNTQGSGRLGSEAGLIPRNGQDTDQANAEPDQGDDQDDDDADAPVDVEFNQPEPCKRGLRGTFSRAFLFVFPSPSKEEDIQAYIPHYRTLPILSGIAIPFCILLEIPGLTEPWYIRMSSGNTVYSKRNPPFFGAAIALSLCCGILANIFLVLRFLEKRIKMMTILCIVFLTVHDVLSIGALAVFGATAGDFSYGQAFWMTLCSTIVSIFTNVTLIIDFVLTHDFKTSGSGLTRRQRSLVIIIIGLFCYIALGALINALFLDLTFINGLYFTVVTIETIGFGDIVPTNTRDRVFICVYATLGIINLAFVVGYIRETVLEGIDFKYRKRLLEIQERRRAAHRRRRAELRWKHAIIWRLRQRHAPVWIPEATDGPKTLWSKFKSFAWRAELCIALTCRRRHRSHRPGTKLNLWTLPRCQLEAAALEAGVPLDSLLPPDFYDTYNPDECYHAFGAEHHSWPSWFVVHPVYHQYATQPLTQRRLGAMAVMLTKVGLSVYESGGRPIPNGPRIQDASTGDIPDSSGTLTTTSDDGRDYRTDVALGETRAYTRRSGFSWVWFLIFWMGGAGIFKATEGWTYGQSIYFCFIAFSTIGYGDFHPVTAAGRSIFVVWALVGVATMTIFISVVSDAYTSRYKGILGRNTFKNAVQQYRKRTRTELDEKVEHIGTWTGVKFVLQGEQQTEVIGDVSPRSSGDAGSDNGAEDGASPAVASTSISKPEPNTHVERVQRSLEQLPQRILIETRSIQQYMQLTGNGGESHEAVQRGTLSTLVDEVMSGRSLPESTKVDILRDAESRQTLMMLGIERSLKELVDISEQAMEAIRERDRIIATLESDRDQVEADGGQRR